MEKIDMEIERMNKVIDTISLLYNRLNLLQFELYVAKQIKDEDKQKKIQKQITRIENKIKNI